MAKVNCLLHPTSDTIYDEAHWDVIVDKYIKLD